MKKNAPDVESEKNYVEEVLHIWTELFQDGKLHNDKEISEALARKLDIGESVASELLISLKTLLNYDRAETETSALEEEGLAVKAALQIQRTMLKAKLQQRLEKGD